VDGSDTVQARQETEVEAVNTVVVPVLYESDPLAPLQPTHSGCVLKASGSRDCLRAIETAAVYKQKRDKDRKHTGK
jgi:hypothetical protein